MWLGAHWVQSHGCLGPHLASEERIAHPALCLPSQTPGILEDQGGRAPPGSAHNIPKLPLVPPQ